MKDIHLSDTRIPACYLRDQKVNPCGRNLASVRLSYTKVEFCRGYGAYVRVISGNEYGCHGGAPKVGGMAGR